MLLISLEQIKIKRYEHMQYTAEVGVGGILRIVEDSKNMSTYMIFVIADH